MARDKILKELRGLLKESYKVYSNASDFNNRKSYSFGKCEAYRNAIELIKGVSNDNR